MSTTPTDEQPMVTYQDLVDTHAQLTNEIMTGEQALPVLREMQLQLARQFLMTQQFVAPVGTRMETIKGLVSNPDAFQANYMTFLRDLQAFHQKLHATCQKLKSVEGDALNPMNTPVLYAIADDFSALMTEYDHVIHPMHRTLYETLANEAPEVLTPTSTEGQ